MEVVEGEFEETQRSNGHDIDPEVLAPIIQVGEEPPDQYPWEQLPGEDHKWYQFFFNYFVLSGFTRSVIGAFRRHREEEEKSVPDKTLTGEARHWYVAATKWNWQERAQAWDEHQRLKDAAKWEERRTALREQEWGVSSKLLQTAQEYVERLISSEDSGAQALPGTPGRVPVPAKPKVRASDISRFAEVGSKIGRLAAGMATDQTMNLSVQARVQEVRKQRWNNVAPLLARVLEDGESTVNDEAVDEPPVEPDDHNDSHEATN
jgi:hypothetical protein